tara:strand:- start:8450 stop:9289 length:840 start_codon:yes stop_codon:yes gene_type:complete
MGIPDSVYHWTIFIAIIAVTFLLAIGVNKIFKRVIAKSSEDLHSDPTNYLFIRHTVIALIYTLGFSIAIYKIPELRVLANSLLAGAGVLALAVGFAAQHALSNVISGIFLVLFKPFRINDRLKVRNLSGIVEDITLRHTVIRDFENKRIIIPNTIISDEIIINSDHGDDEKCKFLDFNISYESDLSKARAIIQEEVINHPLFLDHRDPIEKENGDSPVTVRVINLGEYAVELRAWAWANNASDAFVMGCDLYESIKLKFDNVGIEIPYPHRTIIQKKTI